MNQIEFISNLISEVEKSPCETVLSKRALSYYGRDLDNPVMLVVFFEEGHRDVTLYTKGTEFTVTQEDRDGWKTVEHDRVTDGYLRALKDKVLAQL